MSTPTCARSTRTGPSISVEQAAEIVRVAALAPAESARKVLILDEFHLIRPEAAARLLKTIEEPPPITVFIVLAEQVTPELVTIASRCVRVDFRPLSQATIVAELRRGGVEEEVAIEAARGASGNLDRARLLATDPAAVASPGAVRRSAEGARRHRRSGGAAWSSSCSG